MKKKTTKPKAKAIAATEPETQQVETTVEAPGRLTFGIGGLNNPTPTYITWIFRVEFILNKAFVTWLTATSIIQGDKVKEIILILTIIDFATWGFGRFFGIKKEDLETA